MYPRLLEGETVRDGNDIAALYEKHGEAVYVLCYSYLADQADAQDATQDVFLKLLDRPQRFGGENEERAWLLNTAERRCRTMLKQRRKVEFETIDESLEDTRSMDGTASANEVAEAILALPERLKLLVHLTYYEGKNSEEVAQIVGTSASTVRSHLSEARSLIGSWLKGMRI